MTKSTSTWSLSATELSKGFKSGDLSPVEVTNEALARIESLDGHLGAFCYLDQETTLRSAKESEDRWRSGSERGALDGVPVAVKDVFLTAGWPTLRGSRTVDPKGPWDNDAPTVARLREQGSVLIGKTTTPELGWKGVTDSPLTGITRNPWRTDLTPGGSSGGSAAALAAGMAPLALGTDGGGSIRIPAAFTGVVGIKPTFGRVPFWPASAFGSLAHAGPMGRSVQDVAALLDVLAVPDWRDTSCLPANTTSYLAGLGTGVTGLRVAYCPGWAIEVDPEIAAITARVARLFEELGAYVEEIVAPFEDPIEAFSVLWQSGAAKALTPLDATKEALLDPGLVSVVRAGEKFSALQYLNAVAQRNALSETTGRMFNEFDLLLTPAMPVRPFTAGRNVPEGWNDDDWVSWTPFTYPFNLTGQPAMVLPAGLTDDNLPIGVQLVGARFQDQLVLNAGQALESALALDLPIVDGL